LSEALSLFAAGEYARVTELLRDAPASDVPARLLLRRARLAGDLKGRFEEARRASAADATLRAVAALLSQLDALQPARLSEEACGGELPPSWAAPGEGGAPGKQAYALLLRLDAALQQGGETAALLFGAERVRAARQRQSARVSPRSRAPARATTASCATTPFPHALHATHACAARWARARRLEPPPPPASPPPPAQAPRRRAPRRRRCSCSTSQPACLARRALQRVCWPWPHRCRGQRRGLGQRGRSR